MFARWGLFANYGPDYLLPLLAAAAREHRAAGGARSGSSRTSEDASGAARPKQDAVAAPEDVSVVNVHARVRGLEGSREPPDGVIQRGRDLMWITQPEINALASGRFTATLLTRITLFHLLDITPGVPTGWGAEHIHAAAYEAVPERTAAGTRVRISGSLHLAHASNAVGYDGTLGGELTVEAGQLTALRLITRGRAWAPEIENGWPPTGGHSLQIGFVLSEDASDRRIPPVVASIPGASEACLHYALE